MTRAALGCMICWLAGCSLMQLDDLDLGSCSEVGYTGRPPCWVLDQRDGIPENACRHWQCRSDGRGCELRPKDYDGDGELDAAVCRGADATDCDDEDQARGGRRGRTERCDGVDNDCNEAIDEHSLDGNFELANELRLELRGELAESQLRRVDAHGEGGPRVTVAAGSDAVLVDLQQNQQQRVLYGYSAARGSMSDKNCPTWSGAQACNFRELALGAGPTQLLSAGISDSAGCANGELRLGVGASADSELRLQLGHSNVSVASQVQYGVDTDMQQACPAGGARNPAIASPLEPGSPALAIWLAESVHAARACGAAAGAEVRAIGVWARGAAPAWVASSNGGRSQVLGRTRGLAPPAALGVRDANGASNYLLAYGNTAGALELRVITPVAREEAQPLGVSESQLPGVEGGVDHVALALGTAQAEGADGVSVGSAFRIGCGDQAEIRSATLTLTAAGVALRRTAVVSAQARILDGPSIVHLARGFWASGPERGGWLVAWLEASDGGATLRARRLSESGELLDDEPFEISSGSIHGFVSFQIDAERAAFALWDRAARTLGQGEVLCRRQ